MVENIYLMYFFFFLQQPREYEAKFKGETWNERQD